MNQTTLFNYKKVRKGDWLSLNTSRIFFGTVPTFGFKILIVENVRSQNFIDNWWSKLRKFWRISLLLEWPMYVLTEWLVRTILFRALKNQVMCSHVCFGFDWAAYSGASQTIRPMLSLCSLVNYSVVLIVYPYAHFHF